MRPSTTSRISVWTSRGTSWWSSRASAGRARARWPSTRSTPRGSGSTSNRSAPMPGSSSNRCRSRTSSTSRACRRPLPSSSGAPAATRVRRWRRRRRFTTTSACSSPGWASRTAGYAARPIASQHASQIVDSILTRPEGTKVQICAPLVRGQEGRAQGHSRQHSAGRVRPRARRRQHLRHQERPRAGQEQEARHRGGGRPADRQAGGAHPAGRLDRDGAEAGGGGRSRDAAGAQRRQGQRRRRALGQT